MITKLVAVIIVFVLGMLTAPPPRDSHAQNSRPTIGGPTTITTGGVFQQVLPAFAKFSVIVQNNNTTDSCWVTYGTLSSGVPITLANASEASAILLTTGGVYNQFDPNSYTTPEAIFATCANNGDTLRVSYQ